jgi:hypothetical protein
MIPLGAQVVQSLIVQHLFRPEAYFIQSKSHFRIGASELRCVTRPEPERRRDKIQISLLERLVGPEYAFNLLLCWDVLVTGGVALEVVKHLDELFAIGPG